MSKGPGHLHLDLDAIAEEIEVNLQQVRHAPPNEKLYANPMLATGNSNAVRGAWKPLREAGAVARIMLV